MENTRRSGPAIRLLLIAVCGLLIVAAVLNLLCHPTPEEWVKGYDELSGRTARFCSLPDRDLLPDGACRYAVIRKSRFFPPAEGYLIGFSPAEAYASSVSVTCRTLDALPEGSRRIEAAESYRETELFVREDHIAFLLDGCRYDIHGVEAKDGFVREAMLLARSIIDRRRPDADR